jgi:hypothetical protein
MREFKMKMIDCERCLEIIHYLVEDEDIVDRDVKERIVSAKEHMEKLHECACICARISNHCECSKKELE